MLGPGVVVVGAGVAGLAAARHLRARGVPTTLIEAANRIGGRAWTTTLAGHPFDHGATWLHDAERNPLVVLATTPLIDSDRLRHERVTIAGRPATPAERAAYEAAWNRLDQVVAPALAGPDTTLAAAMAPMDSDPWSPLIALWEGAVIAAADAGQLSLEDWHQNRLHGSNRVPPEGLGAYIAHHLATEARLNTPATHIDWSGQGVRVETPAGTIAAAAAIITVSTGVLAAGTIRFTPPLPAGLQTTIHALPMGLLSKIAFTIPNPARLDLPPDTILIDQQSRMTFNAAPQSRPHLVGYVGGQQAWDLAQDPQAAEDLARTELLRLLGPQALEHLGPALMTRWGIDPNTAGSYAYARPNNAEARAALAQTNLANRILFAGEATRRDGLAGTVAGAYLSGIDAADNMLALTKPPPHYSRRRGQQP